MKKSDLRRILREELQKIVDLNPQSVVRDPLFEQYLANHISEKELTDLLFKELNTLNEGVGDFVSSVVDWILKKLSSLYNSILTAGAKAFGAIRALFNAIAKFEKKYPKLTKVIAIFLVILVILVATASTAEAALSGGEPPINIINAAIGLLENAKGSLSSDPLILSEAQTYLLGLKTQQATDASQYSKEAMHMANFALDNVKDIIQTGSESEKSFLLKMYEAGSNLISSSVEEIRGIGQASIKVRQQWK